MTATIHPSGRRAAATWVGATGSCLVVAAAAVFVAVRWNQIPDLGKLALVAGLTAACLVAGWVLRPALPATGDVLFHLGALLVPVDVAAAGMRLHAGWRPILVTEGLVGAAVFGLLARATSSVTLARTAVLAVVVLSAGIAAVSPVPATLALVLIAVGGEAAHLRRPAAVWAAVGGLAPVLGAGAGWLLSGLGTPLPIGAGTLEELGLSGRPQQIAAAVSGVLAAGVLARQAQAARDVRPALLAFASVAVGLGTSAVAARIDGDATLLGLAALFLIVEVVALVLYDDDFWGRPLAQLAGGAEIPAVAAMAAGAVVLFVTPVIEPALGADPVAGAALALVALGWLAADIRRAPVGAKLLRGAGWRPATAGVAFSLSAAVAAGTGSGRATAVALTVVPAALLAAGRPGAAGIAAGFLPWATLSALPDPWLAAGLGVGGSAVLALVAQGVGDRSAATLLAVEATVLGVLSAYAVARPLEWWQATYLGAATAWFLGTVLDRRGAGLGDVARMGLLLPAAVAVALPPAQAISPLIVITAFYLLDAVRLDRPVVASGAALVVQGLVVEVMRAAGVPVAWTGFALCVSAVAWAGLAAVVDERWRPPLAVAAGAGLFLGPGLAMGDPQALTDSLLVAGGLGVVAGIAARETPMGHVGGVVLTAGIYGQLLRAGITAPEAYVAPIATQLAVAGGQLRRLHRLPSWVAYGPSILLLGGTAFLVRTAGDGAGGHALVAGAVGVGAVIVGGWRRLSGPLLAGTALLGAVGLRESLWALAGVPTWAWLGLGGTLLLGVAVLIERTDTSPVETGRRVVEVLTESFS